MITFLIISAVLCICEYLLLIEQNKQHEESLNYITEVTECIQGER